MAKLLAARLAESLTDAQRGLIQDIGGSDPAALGYSVETVWSLSHAGLTEGWSLTDLGRSVKALLGVKPRVAFTVTPGGAQDLDLVQLLTLLDGGAQVVHSRSRGWFVVGSWSPGIDRERLEEAILESLVSGLAYLGAGLRVMAAPIHYGEGCLTVADRYRTTDDESAVTCDDCLSALVGAR